MFATELLEEALEVRRPWSVATVRLDHERQRLILGLAFSADGELACSKCGSLRTAIEGVQEGEWRVRDFFHFETRINAQIPRVRCERCGVGVIRVTWLKTEIGCCAKPVAV